MNKKKELHLFIIWHNARKYEKRIVDDIQSKFELFGKYEFHWKKEDFNLNLSRFYGAKLPLNSHKEKHCGVGPFVAILVEDKDPLYEKHITTKGEKIVNSKMFTSKTLYREWTGGGHQIHGTNDLFEANHNLTLLFGKNSNDLFKEFKKNPQTHLEIIKENITGHDGWKNFNHLFYILNNTIPYVVLRNFDKLPDSYQLKNHSDIDILTNDYKEISFILNSKKIFKSKNRVHNEVIVAEQKVRFDFRSVGDNYYDEKWGTIFLQQDKFTKTVFSFRTWKIYITACFIML